MSCALVVTSCFAHCQIRPTCYRTDSGITQTRIIYNVYFIIYLRVIEYILSYAFVPVKITSSLFLFVFLNYDFERLFLHYLLTVIIITQICIVCLKTTVNPVS
jgi:hypothetical protein